MNITTLRIIEGPDYQRDEEGWEHNAYTVRLSRKGHTLTIPWRAGIGITTDPTATDVLECLVSDAISYDNALDFEGWAAECGFDEDSRKAEKVYRAVESQTRKLKRFLGDDYEACFETDTYETARWLVTA